MDPAQEYELERYCARWQHLKPAKSPPPVMLRRPGPPPVRTPPIPRRPTPERLEIAVRYAQAGAGDRRSPSHNLTGLGGSSPNRPAPGRTRSAPAGCAVRRTSGTPSGRRP